ncbi:MAG: Citryl-CoA lyase [Fibrobacteres bacterium]|nr:Citryl-CoA lyase [Fibrobacterota bacterium]
MKESMTGPELLRENVGRLKSRMGACFVGSHAVFRGKDLHAELGDAKWIDLYLFGITGRRFPEAQLRLLEALWSYTSYPDARIWNNRVAALAGSSRSTGNLGVSAGLALSEASIYGRGIDIRAIDFLIRTRAVLAAGGELEPWVGKELSARRSLAGYGRPIASGDERIQPIMKLARSLGLADGPHLELAFAIEKALLSGRFRMHMNYGGVVAALAADMGLSPREYYLFMYPAFLAGMLPCYIEASENPEGTLLPLACDHVGYLGAPKRKWEKRPQAAEPRIGEAA